ncbi:hypothetical protein P692DRAFT_20840710 [Suillus brevipes Sb2]|nr:hypothetical protein P692DRAFT_20840710 [Suillus brevipes Sb2]
MSPAIQSTVQQWLAWNALLFLSIAASLSHPISPHNLNMPLPYKYDEPTDSGALRGMDTTCMLCPLKYIRTL